MRICIITDYKESYSSKKFLREAADLGIKTSFFEWKTIVFEGNKLGFSSNKKIFLDDFDAVILRSSITSLTPSSLVVNYCKHKKIRLLNENFYLLHQSVNKLIQQFIFQTKKIPCLKTVYGENLSFTYLKSKLGLPFIAKLAKGSLGKQVLKINSQSNFLRFIRERKKDKQLYLFQKFYKISDDYRIFVIGKSVFGSLKRTAPKGDWRTNIRGSKHEKAENKQVLEIGKVLLERTNIEFAGLDILIDPSGKPRIIELNTMACFRVFDRINPEINIAKKVIQLLKKSV
jgi:ribosomal protein S6--L-glutamate ligase